jgi:hypothetical protein
MTDSEHLDEIRQEVFDYLAKLDVPITTRNVIHAMFNIHYADWLGGNGIIPDCPMQDSYADGL